VGVPAVDGDDDAVVDEGWEDAMEVVRKDDAVSVWADAAVAHACGRHEALADADCVPHVVAWLGDAVAVAVDDVAGE